MEEQVVKKRAWVKNAVIVFLSIMLVLTFFSNTIMNRSLPEVATAYVESGTINAKIRGSGSVTAGESYDVVLDQTRQVASVLVQVGDTVNTGDVLFTLAETESEELQQAMTQLAQMRLEYEKALLNMDTADYAQENRNIQKARDALAKAQAELAACNVTETDVLAAQTAVKDAQRQQKQLSAALTEAQQELAAATGEYSALEGQIESWQSQIASLNQEISKAQAQIYQLQSGSGNLEAQLSAAKTTLASHEAEYAKLRITYGVDYDTLAAKAARVAPAGDVITQMQALVNAYKNTLPAPATESADPSSTPNVTDNDKMATANEAEAFEKLQPVIEKISTAEAEVARVQALVDAQASVNEQITALRDSINSKAYEQSTLSASLRSALYEQSELENEMKYAQNAVDTLEYQLENAADRIEQLNEAYSELQNNQSRYETALDTVEACQTNLEDLMFALAERKKADGKLAASQQLDLDNAQKNILEQEELIAELQTNALGAEVTAKVSGQISSLNISAGRDATAGETLAVIEVVDRGYTVRMPVTTEQSKRVRVGDKADVTNYYWGEQIEATLTQIINDPQNPGKGKLLVFTLTGDISSGQNVTLAVGERSANFDSIIPNSALRTDTNGSFVFVITAKSSPLGNRYIATRADVQVLAQDDTTAAVSGLSMGDYVITTASKPLEAGMQVNMVEN